MSVLGIVLALFEREITGKGTIIDNSLTDSSLYLSSFILSMKRNGFWNDERGMNHLDSGAPFYNVYECKDGRFLCVGALETKFFKEFLKGLGFDNLKSEKLLSDQFKKEEWNITKKLFEDIIRRKALKSGK